MLLILRISNILFVCVVLCLVPAPLIAFMTVKIINIDTQEVYPAVVDPVTLKEVPGVSALPFEIEKILFDGKEIQAGDYVNETAEISVVFTAESDQVSSWNIQVLTKENNEVHAVSYGVSDTLNSQLPMVSTSTKSTSNEYYLSVTAESNSSTTATLSSPIYKVAATTLGVTDFINGPNPFNPNNESTAIQFQLTKDATVNIYIYTISGKQIWTQTITGTTGFNTLNWDGKNRYGEVVANGIYIAYLIANDGDSNEKGKLKIAVLK